MEARNAKDLGALPHAIRGMWFDLFRLDYDRQDRQFRLPLSYSKRPNFEKLLTVTDVSDVTVNGRMTGEICELQRLDVSDNSVRLTSDFPLEVVLTTGDDRTIEITDLPRPYRVRSIDINVGEAISSLLRFLHLKAPPS